jgi:hypothetical protein
MSMNLALRVGGEYIDLYQTPTELTMSAIKGDTFERYAEYVHETISIHTPAHQSAWNYDELEPDPAETHLRYVSALIAFAGARFVVV